MEKLFKRFAMVMVLLISTFTTGSTQVLEKKISYDCRHKPVQRVLEELGKRKRVALNYSSGDLQDTKPVTLHFSSATLEEIFDSLCTNQPIDYRCKNEIIYIFRRPPAVVSYAADSLPVSRIRGRVTDSLNRPIAGVTISIKPSTGVAITNVQGEFSFTTCQKIQQLIFSCVGYEDRVISLAVTATVNVVLSPSSAVEGTVLVNFTKVKPGTTLMSIDHIDGQVLPQVMPDIPTTLAGLAPGLLVRRSNGSPGSAAKIQIRNNGWIGFDHGNEPLVIVDQTYLPPSLLNQLQNLAGNPNATGGIVGALSLLQVINPDDIESIEILKDAAATSVYGAKGANGVIIINTKKGKKGDAFLTGMMRVGIGQARRHTDLLSTNSYIRARIESFAFDKQPFDSQNAPDLKLYDTTRYTDYWKEFLGQQAMLSHVYLAVSHYTEMLSYRLSVGYNKETAVLPGKKLNKQFYDQEFFLKGNLRHEALQGRLQFTFDGSCFVSNTYSIAADIASAVNLFPNAPRLLDNARQLIWYDNFFNPYSWMLQPYNARMNNLLAHAGVQYQVLPSLHVRANGGINQLGLDEYAALPIAAQDPIQQPLGSAAFGKSKLQNLLLELLVDYKFNRKIWNTGALLGASLLQQKESRHLVLANGYTSDLLLPVQQAAASQSASNTASKSGYIGAFLNTNTVISQQYLLDLTLRVDGSSRFGEDNKYAMFWGIGGGWILSNAQYLPLPGWITLAKIRATYGTSGNDAIGEYQYEDIYAAVNAQRQGLATFLPVRHNNKQYGWGKARKFEIATEWTVDSQFTGKVAWYHNTTTNQLIDQPLPGFTGFGTIRRNIDAQVVSEGVEFQFQKKTDLGKDCYWTWMLTVAFPKNKLQSFPGLEQNATYRQMYTVGKSLSSQKGLVFLGVEEATGQSKFLDVNGNNQPDTADYQVIGNQDPHFFGGFQCAIRYKAFILDLCWEFAAQKGPNYLLQYNPLKFGSNGLSNIPVQLLNRWSTPGQQNVYPAYGAVADNIASQQLENLRNSSLQIVDASYLRLKNICLSYSLRTSAFFKSFGTMPLFFVAAENGLLFTRYRGADPNAQNFSGIPLLKKYCIGVKFNVN